MLKLTFKLFALGILTGSLLFFYHRPGFSQAAPPRVVAADQPGSPLLIVPTAVDSGNPLRPQYEYSLTNTTDKSISAYTIQESVSIDSGAPMVGGAFTHFPAIKLFLQPRESRAESGGHGRIYRQPPLLITLTVDFVEFADGTRWGDDTGKFGERLDGKRAGGKAAIRKYREILAQDGVDGLAKALSSPDLIKSQDLTKSYEWIEGFETGVNTVKSRLAEAKNRGGEDMIRRELAKPFDSTEGRQDP